jgi:predicted oxidoreductase
MSVEQSLKNLKTDYLDVLLLHRPSPLMDAEIIAKVIQELQIEGKIKSLGVSNFTPSQMDLIKKEVPIQWNQIECSLTREHPLFDGSLDYLKVHGLGAMAWSPLGSYFKENSPQEKRIQKTMQPLLTKYNCSEDQLLLAWLMHHPSHIYPVVGTTSVHRLKNALDAEKIKLEITDWFLLLEASMGEALP